MIVNYLLKFMGKTWKWRLLRLNQFYGSDLLETVAKLNWRLVFRNYWDEQFSIENEDQGIVLIKITVV